MNENSSFARIFPFSTASCCVSFLVHSLENCAAHNFPFFYCTLLCQLFSYSLRSVVTVLHLHTRVQRSLRSRGFASLTVSVRIDLSPFFRSPPTVFSPFSIVADRSSPPRRRPYFGRPLCVYPRFLKVRTRSISVFRSSRFGPLRPRAPCFGCPYPVFPVFLKSTPRPVSVFRSSLRRLLRHTAVFPTVLRCVFVHLRMCVFVHYVSEKYERKKQTKKTDTVGCT